MIARVNTGASSQTLGIYIHCPPQEAYAFIADPENLSLWAAGLGRAVRKTDDGWLVETPGGPAVVRFAEKNGFGILDHYVYPAPGVEIYVPIRVVAHGTGSEIIFTLFRQPGMIEEKYAEDLLLVERDLETLKRILEGGS